MTVNFLVDGVCVVVTGRLVVLLVVLGDSIDLSVVVLTKVEGFVLKVNGKDVVLSGVVRCSVVGDVIQVDTILEFNSFCN